MAAQIGGILKTHIPDHAIGRTWCGRRLEPRPAKSGREMLPRPRCIDLRRDCIEATCAACHRSDDRRQAEAYRADFLASMFAAACRWAAAQGASYLTFKVRRRVAVALVGDLDVGPYCVVTRTEEELIFDAEF